MRPTPTEADEPLYECYRCGNRERYPDSRRCERCDGRLRNIARSRDR